MNNIFEIKLEDYLVSCELVVNEKRKPSLVIDVEKGVILTALEQLTEEQVAEILKKNEELVLSYYEELQKLMSKNPPFKVREGEKVLYLGEEYDLSIERISKKTGKVRMEDNKVLLDLPESFVEAGEMVVQDKVYGYMKKWYREEGAIICEEIKSNIAKELGLDSDKIKITLKEMKDSWSNCSVAKKNISLNWKSILLSKDDIRFLLCLEMTKLKEDYDTEEYWSLLNRLYPNFRETMNRLNNINPVYFFYVTKLKISNI